MHLTVHGCYWKQIEQRGAAGKHQNEGNGPMRQRLHNGVDIFCWCKVLPLSFNSDFFRLWCAPRDN